VPRAHRSTQMPEINLLVIASAEAPELSVLQDLPDVVRIVGVGQKESDLGERFPQTAACK
jgi:hypothetical protein